MYACRIPLSPSFPPYFSVCVCQCVSVCVCVVIYNKLLLNHLWRERQREGNTTQHMGKNPALDQLLAVAKSFQLSWVSGLVAEVPGSGERRRLRVTLGLYAWANVTA